MRYLKQRDKYSCGPIAIANAIKWYGGKERAKDLRKHFISVCECSPNHGASVEMIHKAILEESGFHCICPIVQPKIEDLDKYLNNGWVAILVIYYFLDGAYGSHAFLCTRSTPKMYEVINWGSRRKTVSKISKHAMKKDLDFNYRSFFSLHYPVAWFIKGKER
jgi:hypothetical protein